MKRKSILLCTLLILCLFVACGASDDGENTLDTITGTNEVEAETEADLASQMTVEQYVIKGESGYAEYFIVLTNNSNLTVKVDVNAIAKDNTGNIIGTADSEKDAIGDGETVCLRNRFSGIEGVESFEYSLEVSEDAYFKSVVKDIQVQESRTDKKIILTCANNGDEIACDVEAHILFFKNGEIVGYEWTDIGDFEMSPGATISEEIIPSGEYDDIKVFIHGYK